MLITLLCNSCNTEDQILSVLLYKNVNLEATTRTSYLKGTITGEMNPYVGDGTYTYRINISSQKNPIGVRISAVGGNAKFKRTNQGQFRDVLEVQIPTGSTQFLFDVLWTKADNGAVIMVRPNKSTIELTADLKNINVQMKPMVINITNPFELGDTTTLWCNYALNKDINIKWIYDKNYFSEISQNASVALSKFEIDLKSIKACKGSDISVEVHDFFINSIGARSYFTARKSSRHFDNIGPQINGQQNVMQYKNYVYSITDSKAHSFSWTGDNIMILEGQNSSAITIVPVNIGIAYIKVSYKYEGLTDIFTNEYTLNVTKTSMKLRGPDIICDEGTFTIENFPESATVDWVVNDGLFSVLNRTNPTITLKNLALPGGSSINANITATVHMNSISVAFSKPFTFNISGIQEDNHNITGYFFEYEGHCELSPVPIDASDFVWQIDNGWSVDMQGYHIVSFSSTNGKPFSGLVWVTVSFTDGCGNRTTIYNSFEVGSEYSTSSSQRTKNVKK